MIAGRLLSESIDKEINMGWLASFKGLRKLGAPPLLAAAVLAALFILVRRSGDNQDDPVAATTSA